MLSIVGWLGAAYGAAVGLARLSYRLFLYPAPQVDLAPLPPGASLLSLRAADGVVAHAVLWPPADGAARTLVHFHGNGETIADNFVLASLLHERGLGVALVEYRGYGVSRGATPSEAGLYLDATAALDALSERGIDAAHVVLWGTSLGTGVAVEMARRGRGAALVLVAPYTSIPKVAARHVPIFPMRLVFADRYDSLSKAGEIRVPTLVIQGDRDEVIPFDMGQTLTAAIPGARLITVAGGHHNDLFALEGEMLLDAIATHAKR
jgi:fermentation-respiration switch protein FrsA (DUF1100 family)